MSKIVKRVSIQEAQRRRLDYRWEMQGGEPTGYVLVLEDDGEPAALEYVRAMIRPSR